MQSRKQFEDELADKTAELLFTRRTQIGPTVVTLEPPSRGIDLDRLAPGEGLLDMVDWSDRHGLPVDVWRGCRRVARIEPTTTSWA